VTSSTGSITFTGSGSIQAKGGSGGGGGTNGPGSSGGGSGGTVRLVAPTITANGQTINVVGGASGSAAWSTGGAGSAGRVRLEGTITGSFTFGSVPGSAISMTDQRGPQVLPNAPTLTITQVAGVNAPAAPTGSLATPDILLPSGSGPGVTVTVQAAQIPPGTTVTLTVRGLSGTVGAPVTATLAGTAASSTASATVTIPTTQPAIISAAATFTLVAGLGQGPVYAEGEPVERVQVRTRFGGPSEVTYITASGRHVAMAAAR
jgi:hypothetical protein